MEGKLMRKKTIAFIIILTVLATFCLMTTGALANSNTSKIVHDGEYYFLEKQHGKKWAKEDTEIDAKLAEIHKKNGGKRPNILYILVDDVSFGQMGNRTMNYVMGIKTPEINKFAEEGLSFMRMYTEPSCTPTRARRRHSSVCHCGPAPASRTWSSAT